MLISTLNERKISLLMENGKISEYELNESSFQFKFHILLTEKLCKTFDHFVDKPN